MSTPTPPPAEPTPDREERELADLYRQLPGGEPDAALDSRILDRARRAVAPRPRRYRHLLVGFGSLSALVMAAGLTWHMVASNHGPRRDASPASAPAQKPAEAAHPASQAIPFRILAEPSAKPSRDMPARKAYAPPAAVRATSPPPKARTLVVPVRILPGSQTPTAGRQVPSAGSNADATMAQARLSGPAPSARILVKQARVALSRGDEAHARTLVREYVRAYPGRALPTDLAPYAPAGADKGSP
jgi:hypothetical protein